MTEPAPLSRPHLRRMLRKARRALTPSEQRQAAHGLYRQLAQHPLFRRAKHISLYLPTDGEIDPRLLLRAAQRRGKATYLPVLSAWPRTKMVFQRVRPGDKLLPNRFRILEPRVMPIANAKSGRWTWCCCRWWGSMMWVGAWAWAAGFTTAAWPIFRRQSWRKPTLLGLAHECQKVGRLAQASWDVPLAGRSPISSGMSHKRRWKQRRLSECLS